MYWLKLFIYNKNINSRSSRFFFENNGNSLFSFIKSNISLEWKKKNKIKAYFNFHSFIHVTLMKKIVGSLSSSVFQNIKIDNIS